MVVTLDILPRRLAPVDDGVWTGWPITGLWSHLHVDAVEHRLDFGNYGVELTPLGPGIQLQHVKLGLGLSTVFCRRHKDPSSKEITPATTPTMNYSHFSSSASFFARPDAFSFSS